jgi:hypothetical protein
MKTALLIDVKNKTITKKKFEGDYHSIHKLMGDVDSDINYIPLSTNDLLWYQMDSESEDGVIFNGNLLMGNLVVTGEPTKDSHEYDWNAKNVFMPECIIQDHIQFVSCKDVNLN